MIQRNWTYCLLFTFSVCFTAGIPQAVSADEQAKTFLDGVRYYESKEYANAVEAFLKLTDDGVQNGKLYYNLANAYLKNGDIGLAILWYERALKMMPNDPDLRFNLDYAKTLVTDKSESTSSPLVAVMFFWKDLFSKASWQWIALGLNLLFWGAVAAWFGFKKRVFKTLSYCFLIVTGIALGTVFYHEFMAVHRPEAIILPASVSIRSGFAFESTELFVLHAGTRVAVEKKEAGFYRIRFSKDKIGWIEDTLAGII